MSTAPASSIDALMSLHDEDFVDGVYATLMGRPADAEGRAHYTEQLRRGVAREDIIAIFAASAEGRRIGANLPGLAAILERPRATPPGRLQRYLQRAITAAIEPLAARSRAIENRVYRIDKTAESTARQLGPLVEHGRQLSARVDLLVQSSVTRSNRMNESVDAMVQAMVASAGSTQALVRAALERIEPTLERSGTGRVDGAARSAQTIEAARASLDALRAALDAQRDALLRVEKARAALAEPAVSAAAAASASATGAGRDMTIDQVAGLDAHAREVFFRLQRERAVLRGSR